MRCRTMWTREYMYRYIHTFCCQSYDIYICLYAHVYIAKQTADTASNSMHTHIHAHTPIRTLTHTHSLTHTHAIKHTMHLCIYISIYLHTHVHAHTLIRTPTHTHTLSLTHTRLNAQCMYVSIYPYIWGLYVYPYIYINPDSRSNINPERSDLCSSYRQHRPIHTCLSICIRT